MSTFKLRGRVERGMFPTEVSFVVTDHAGNTCVVLIPREMVDETQEAPTINVRSVGQKDDVVLVRVPGEPLNSNVVSVNASELVPA